MANKKQLDFSALSQAGFSLPQNDDLERKVLGSIIFLGNRAIEEIGNNLRLTSFYDSRHVAIFKTIMEMASKNKPINMLNLSIEMKENGTLDSVGGVTYISSICNVSSISSLDYDIKVLTNYEKARELIYLCVDSAQKASSFESIQEVTEYLEKGLTNLSTIDDKAAVSIDDALEDFYDYLLELQNGDNASMYFSTGFKKLDDVLNGGFHKSNLIVFGGRPGNFKTSLSIAFAKAALRQHKKVLFVNIEMTTNDIVSLLVSDGVNSNNLYKGTLSPEEMNTVEWNMSRLRGQGLSISSTCNTFNGIVSLLRKKKRTEGLDFAIIDYLGLIECNINKERRQLEIAYMTRNLKALSKELDIPILLLSQLKRPMPGEKTPKPRLEDLRESGDIEQDADIVIFTHRPDKGERDEATNRLWFNRGMFVVAKNRRGVRDVEIPYAHDPFCKIFVDDGDDDPAWGCGDVLAFEKFSQKYQSEIPTSKFDAIK